MKTTETWKLYWMRASGKWHAYDPGEFHQLEHALAVVNQDGYGCFFG